MNRQTRSSLGELEIAGSEIIHLQLQVLFLLYFYFSSIETTKTFSYCLDIKQKCYKPSNLL